MSSFEGQIEGEHVGIRAQLRELEVIVSAVQSGPGGALAGAFAQLTQVLAQHFNKEEASDMFTALPERLPDLAPEIERLKVEHADVLQRLRLAQQNAAKISEIRAQVIKQAHEVVEIVRRHEKSEGELLQRAFLAEM